MQEAEDLTARTFYRALDKLDTYEDRGLPFSAWLFRIAHNLTANWHRDHSQRSFLSLDRLLGHGTDKDTPEEQVTQQEETGSAAGGDRPPAGGAPQPAALQVRNLAV